MTKPAGLKTSFVEYISLQIKLCGKTQEQIAHEMGLSRQNNVSMIKGGRIRLPVGRITGFARAVGVDALFLYSLWMAEYEPENWKVVQNILKQPVLSLNELEILEVIRSAKVINPCVRTDEERARILEAIETLKPGRDYDQDD